MPGERLIDLSDVHLSNIFNLDEAQVVHPRTNNTIKLCILVNADASNFAVLAFGLGTKQDWPKYEALPISRQVTPWPFHKEPNALAVEWMMKKFANETSVPIHVIVDTVPLHRALISHFNASSERSINEYFTDSDDGEEADYIQSCHVHTLPPHTTATNQPLDLGVIATVAKLFKEYCRAEGNSVQDSLRHALLDERTLHSIRLAFQKSPVIGLPPAPVDN